MYIWTLLGQIFHSLNSHKLRSFLAMFGIMWGTLAVVLLLALGNGYASATQKQLASISSGLILVLPGVTSIPYKGEPSGRPINISLQNVLTLAQVFKDIRWITPVFNSSNQQPITYHTKESYNQVLGVSGQYAPIQQIKMTASSRFINKIDIQQNQRVAFIGYQVKQDLFGSMHAIDHTIKVNGIPFLVIGVLSDKTAGNFSSAWNKNNIFIPYTTYLATYGNQNVSNLSIIPKHINQAKRLTASVKDYLANQLRFSPKDDRAVYIPNFTKVADFFGWFFFSIRAFLAFAGFMTLGVGGIGVANIMYLIISERTAEICLRMALGARSSHVISQILLESFLIIFTGGLIGIFIAISIIGVLQVVPLPTWIGRPFISLGSITITLVILAIVTFLSGWSPAQTAAKTPPAQALH